MRWRFVLIDRFNNRTAIDEPIGWDSFSIKLKRHAVRHGTVREVGSLKFQFIGTGADLLRAEYEKYGVRGKYELQIMARCSKGWDEVYTGAISFDGYKFICEETCSVFVGIDQTGALVNFINRFDQKVDISSNVAFDKVTALPNYQSLSKVVALPSKTIKLVGAASNAVVETYSTNDDPQWQRMYQLSILTALEMQATIAVVFRNVTSGSLHSFTPQFIGDVTDDREKEYVPEIIFNDPVQEHPNNGVFPTSFRVKGILQNTLGISVGSHTVTLVLKKGFKDYHTDAVTLQTWPIYNGNNAVHNTPFDITYNNNALTIVSGEYLWLNFVVRYRRYGGGGKPELKFSFYPESFFKSETLSVFPETPAKLYMIHETASRVIESITNGAYKLSSSYYGRVDSEPYSFLSRGCGALRGITTGLDVRRAKLANGDNPKLFLSMKDVFDNLNAIDNIGIGPEGPGKIAIENWRYFYKDEVVFHCKDIEKVEKEIVADEHYSVFKFGYEKWESEDFNGLDEFLTKREYRTDLSEVQNTFEQICKWIASGYAWEVTRRKGPDSKDFRYDNDTFILCLKNGYLGIFGIDTNVVYLPNWYGMVFAPGDQVRIKTPLNEGTFTVLKAVLAEGWQLTFAPGLLTTEQLTAGLVDNLTHPSYSTEIANVIDGENLLDPQSVYNFAISPVRNAMRWFNRVAACYRNITDKDALTFMAGDGNYLAKGVLYDPLCRIEATKLAENETLTLNSFADPEEAKPFRSPERIKYSYPMSYEDYAFLSANPYGLIEWNDRCEKGQAWIDDIEWFAEEGKANFLLIPKVEA